MARHSDSNEAKQYLKKQWKNDSGDIECPNCGSADYSIMELGDDRMQINCDDCGNFNETSFEYKTFL